ncbi:uncharacterized protein LOC111604501 [Drosophila hydei]|uniref:Uncharacterized protein LOC111604501 n=1 Tax=Drosophila hydei TaxID=7224 RepID=A0A6J2SVJ3_DROHY|nr:uncharacterized protein LOC111604501 [Drosophila hydei]
MRLMPAINGVEKFFVIAFAVIAAASATSIATDYLPPVDNNLEVAAEPIDLPLEQGALGDNGYRYKTVRRLKYRHRRDVSELPSAEYLPPVGEVSQDIGVAGPIESAPLADDGYRYKTVRRLKYRHRRDVSELPSAEYLPPVGEVSQDIGVAGPIESAPLADDGYRYKTVRRLKYRHRRDVNELPSAEYLPPVGEVSQDIGIAGPIESAPLADDGYRYKTVRRLKYRHRRDVNELPSAEYLPPVGEVSQDIGIAGPIESAPLADDGYRYKTVRRLKYRHRRDVNELPSAEYLPPVGEVSQDIGIAGPIESAPLADDGYRYKTVRRLKYRHRRDVSELPSAEYLPPVGEVAQDIGIAGPIESAPLADDGYRYKTVRRLKYRQRRDVSEIANEYLPPVEQAVIDVPAEGQILGDDGYRYKTVRRLKFRRH